METLESRRVREVRLSFGLMGGERERAREMPLPALPAAGIVLITGASGSGKSTLLGRIRRTLPGVRLERIRLAERAVVDCFALPVERTLALLSRAGLAEAGLWLRQPRALSEGERFRLRLALWMARPRCALIADEFCNALDRITARGVAWQLRRFVAGEKRLAIVATAHEDLAGDLRPAAHVRLPETMTHEDTKSRGISTQSPQRHRVAQRRRMTSGIRGRKLATNEPGAAEPQPKGGA